MCKREFTDETAGLHNQRDMCLVVIAYHATCQFSSIFLPSLFRSGAKKVLMRLIQPNWYVLPSLFCSERTVHVEFTSNRNATEQRVKIEHYRKSILMAICFHSNP